jgi:hypothetical protein
VVVVVVVVGCKNLLLDGAGGGQLSFRWQKGGHIPLFGGVEIGW